MRFISITRDIIDRGAEVFDCYARATVCGTLDRSGQEAARWRQGGVEAIPGATIACLESGILDKNAVVSAVSRATRCRRPTVEQFLHEFVVGVDACDEFDENAGLMLERRLLSGNVIVAA